MKLKATLCTFLLASTFYFLSAQLNTVNYTFLKTTGTYSNVTAGTTLNDGASIPIGFPFYHYGIRFDTLYATMEGYVDLTSEINNCESTLGAFVAFCDVDPNFNDSGIRYKLSGNAGSRILIIEWRNVAIDFPGTADNDDHVNFQIALFEGTNKIEYRYGPNLITDLNADLQGYDGPQVYHEIAHFLTFQTRNMWLYFSAASPSVLTDFTGADDNIVGAPANGTIYRFTPSAATSIGANAELQSVTVFPNPTNSFLSINLNSDYDQQLNLVVTDLSGRVTQTSVNTLKAGNNNTELDCSQWAAGVYYLQLTTGVTIWTKKIVKQ